MEFVREIVKGSELAGIIKLPRSLSQGHVELIVLPAPYYTTEPEQKVEGKAVREGSITQKLSGILHDDGKLLQDIRAERLSARYESND